MTPTLQPGGSSERLLTVVRCIPGSQRARRHQWSQCARPLSPAPLVLEGRADPSSADAISLRTAVGCAATPDIDDGGDLIRGNHRIHPQLPGTSRCVPLNHSFIFTARSGSGHPPAHGDPTRRTAETECSSPRCVPVTCPIHGHPNLSRDLVLDARPTAGPKRPSRPDAATPRMARAARRGATPGVRITMAALHQSVLLSRRSVPSRRQSVG